MSDTIAYCAVETGTYVTGGSPNPKVTLSGSAAPVYAAYQALGGALTNGQTVTVTVVNRARRGVFAVYSGATYTAGAPNIVDLSTGTLRESAGTLANTDAVEVFAIPPHDPADLLAGRLLTPDERAGFDVVTTPIDAANPPATMADLEGIGGGGAWGEITGDIADQTDLALALGACALSADLGGAALLDVGTTTGTVAAGDDGRLSDARTPVAHDQAETTITFTDVTTGNASTTAHGYAPKATAPGAGLLSVLGIGNGETVRTDKVLFDDTNPANLGTAAPGTSLLAARRDHVHTAPAVGDPFSFLMLMGA